MSLTGWALQRGLALSRRLPVEAGHGLMLRALDRADRSQAMMGRLVREGARLPLQPVTVGGVVLPRPVIVAAGLVKGRGFPQEAMALEAARRWARGFMPGFRALPALLGPVEFGSFTRWPRLGNAAPVLWRDPATRSLQNRIGLRNPGLAAALVFLRMQADQGRMTDLFGLNLAPTPGLEDLRLQRAELVESLDLLLSSGLKPGWVTLNWSCPNTGDDPAARALVESAERLAGLAAERLAARAVPVWVKLAPDLGPEIYARVAEALARVGVRAVIATNTRPEPAPGRPGVMAGVSGGRLFGSALAAVRALAAAGAPGLDIIGCGGVLGRVEAAEMREAGAKAVMIWSALVWDGPRAPAHLLV